MLRSIVQAVVSCMLAVGAAMICMALVVVAAMYPPQAFIAFCVVMFLAIWSAVHVAVFDGD